VQTTLGWGEILLRLILAAMVGRILGYNRTERGHPAGLRTMLLVAVAAALIATGGPADDDLRVLLRREGLSIQAWQLRIDKGQEQTFRYDVKFRAKGGDHPARRLLHELTATPGVVNVEFQCLEN
jgi:MgtC family